MSNQNSEQIYVARVGNVLMQVVIGFGFTSDWLKKWHEIFKPITGHNKLMQKQSNLLITFEAQLKTTLLHLPIPR